MMKKLLALLLALMMLFSAATVFAGCEDSDSKKSSASDDEDKDDESKEDEDKDDETKDDENKEDEDKDNEDKDDEEEENKDDEEQEEEDKPSVDESVLQDIQDLVSETADAYYGFADEMNMDLAPEDVYDYIEYLYDHTKEDFSDVAQTYSAYIQDALERQVGANMSLSTVVEGYEAMDEADLEAVAEGMNLSYGDRVDDDAFTEGYFVELDMTLTGDEETVTNETESFAVVCYDGQWYVIKYEVEDDFFYCDFYFRDVISTMRYMIEYPEDYE